MANPCIAKKHTGLLIDYCVAKFKEYDCSLSNTKGNNTKHFFVPPITAKSIFSVRMDSHNESRAKAVKEAFNMK